ncbi:odorant Hypothetical protein protein [Nesidiocoris tenuis]|uniref:Uncharacterized protein n=1 Tax=Nesidiocoris tenuis TaxID=355587 RepID=A0ABN7BAZ7_9HEMI|nr:odorant Hypothetical protein protein [Nesidiocoris tenuis]
MYSSETAFVVFVTIGIGFIHGAVTEDFKLKMKTIAGECATETKGNPDSFAKVWNSHTLPDSEDDMCFLACMMKKYGAFADGKFNAETMNGLNKQRWTDAGDVEKADKITADCIAEVKTEGVEDCTLAHEMLECLFKKFDEVGISSSDHKDF